MSTSTQPNVQTRKPIRHLTRLQGARSEVVEIKRHVSISTQNLLWGRSAGRCEFAGCNKQLWKSSVTSETVNIAQKAHIYSFSAGGPRGNEGIPRKALNSIDNLLLVCHECHEKIDQAQDGGRYTADLLKQMKYAHEKRIELVTGIEPSKKSHVLLYGANIGEHNASLNFASTASALFPHRYPAIDDPISLGITNSAGTDRDQNFWMMEGDNLAKQFSRRVKDRLSDGEIEHLSVFALAPQPLLIQLGVLLGDIAACDIYQLHREPQGWAWQDIATPEFIVCEPSDRNGSPVLVLALSATVRPERITSVLGEHTSIWTITVQNPHNDLLQTRAQLGQLRSLLRQVFDRIKSVHGQSEVLHIFPAAPVSACVELGRVRMPKADMPWKVYDQNNRLGGFVPALPIS